MAKKDNKNSQDTFTWVGVNSRGKKLEGEMSGQSIALVKAQLRKQGITPSKVKKKAKPLFGLESKQKIGAKDIDESRRMSIRDSFHWMISFTRGTKFGRRFFSFTSINQFQVVPLPCLSSF